MRLVVEAPDMGGETDGNKYFPYTLQGVQLDAQTSEIIKPDYVTLSEGGKLVVAKGASVEIQSIEGKEEQIQNDGEIKLTEDIDHEP